MSSYKPFMSLLNKKQADLIICDYLCQLFTTKITPQAKEYSFKMASQM